MRSQTGRGIATKGTFLATTFLTGAASVGILAAVNHVKADQCTASYACGMAGAANTATGSGFNGNDSTDNSQAGGDGQAAGFATITNTATSGGDAQTPIAALANGGKGGAGAAAGEDGGHFLNGPSDGGKGGQGGTATVTNAGTILWSEDEVSNLVSAWANGGDGGNARDGSGFNGGSTGGSGGNGGTATATNSGSLQFIMGGTAVVNAQANGGGGMTSGGAGFHSEPGNGGNGGNGGRVTVLNDTGASITATAGAAGILASAKGGTGGGDSGSGTLVGGAGGNGGTVAVTNNGGITQTVLAGIAADASAGTGGWGARQSGAGGNGGTVTVTTAPTSVIATSYGKAAGVSATAAGGGGGTAGAGDTGGATGGNGGAGGTTTVTAQGSITTSGSGAHGILATSSGGQGAAGGDSDFDPDNAAYTEMGGAGGNGGAAGNVSVVLGDGTRITTNKDSSDGVHAASTGGNGGNGGKSENTQIGGNGVAGGNGGAGGFVTVVSSALITTNGDNSAGISAASSGGKGGAGGVFDGAGSTTGGTGGTGGSDLFVNNAFPAVVSVTNSGAIVTGGKNSPGVTATSTGGAAGAGADAMSLIDSHGGAPGTAGAGGTVGITNAGTIQTAKDLSYGMIGASTGGGGGAGGNASSGFIVSVAVGGDGSNAGAGGAVTLANTSQITTSGDAAAAMLAQSVGGGGGIGGDVDATAVSVAASISVSIGGNGSGGGDGGKLSITNAGAMTTQGFNAPGVEAISVGGGGGTGGRANSASYTAGYGDVPEIIVSVTVGGNGGQGGAGGAIAITNSGSIDTGNAQSVAVAAYSIGGGGGNGGNATTQSYAIGTGIEATVNTSVGGSAGSGGTGGTVNVSNTGALSTHGFASDALYALSVGGGGGNGGVGNAQSSDTIPVPGLDLLPISASLSFSANVAVGGGGGQGNTGGDITLGNAGAITTHGIDSRGIFAQSVGGGGGIAASGKGTSAEKYTVNVGVGGNGGGGGNGGSVTVTNTGAGTIITDKDGSHGIQAQSIGGGGGSGGTSSAEKEGSAVATAAKVAAKNLFIDAVKKYLPKLAAKRESWFKYSPPSVSVAVAVGGKGGASGNGGAVQLTNEGAVTTGGKVAFGLFGQSVGGGGGNGGAATVSGGNVVNTGVGIGGAGGAAGNGGAVKVDNPGSILTADQAAFGIVAQSVGGGGGLGGLGINDSVGLSLMVHIGGSGAASGAGGTVAVTSAGSIQTKGEEAHGIVAQSIGGGGGLTLLNPTDTANPRAAAAAQAITSNTSTDPDTAKDLNAQAVAADPDMAALQQQAFDYLTGQGLDLTAITTDYQQQIKDATGTLSLALGGQSGARGDAGAVTVEVGGTINTAGPGAFGVVAQSIGGGGGLAADGAGGNAALAMTGTLGGGTGNGGAVGITLDGGSRITTTGDGSIGVFAQSIGGGGGYTGGFDASGMTDQTFLAASGLTAGNGGKVTIQTGPANADATGVQITTKGRNAHGVFAQSLNGGGGAVGSAAGVVIPGSAGNAPRSGSTPTAGGSEAISIDLSGTISATGQDAVGIYAQSGTQGISGAISSSASSNGNISVAFTGTLTGGSGTGAAMMVDGGSDNTILIRPGSTVGAGSGMAILGTSGSETVTNAGVLNGSVDLGSGTNRFTNNGTFNSGAVVNLGGGLLTNNATISPGGAGTIASTTVTGDFVQTATGTYAPDIDGRSGTSDRLIVTGNAKLAGLVKPVLSNPVPGKTLSILTGAALNQTPALQTASDAVAYSYALVPANTDLLIAVNANFAPTGVALNASQARVANSLQQLWNSNAADPASAALYNAVARAGNGAALGTTLSGLAAQSQQAAAASAAQTQQFTDNLHSCPAFSDGGAKLGEGACVWQRTMGQFASQNTAAETGGYNARSLTVQFGAQKPVAPGWVVGLSGAYTASRVKASSGLETTSGRGFLLGGVVKRELGAWTLSGALHAGMNWYDTDRAVSGSVEPASSSSQMLSIGGRLRAAYQIPFQTWYLKPYADLDVTHTHQPGFTESGAGLMGVRTLAADHVTVSGSPMLEVGGRIDHDDFQIRPFLAVGLTAVSRSARDVEQRFANAPASAPSWRTTTAVPERLGRINAGVDLAQIGGMEIKGEYGLRFASGYTSQTASLRLGQRF